MGLLISFRQWTNRFNTGELREYLDQRLGDHDRDRIQIAAVGFEAEPLCLQGD
ncbi:unnamed protein product, partial [marine sediment metagenome]